MGGFASSQRREGAMSQSPHRALQPALSVFSVLFAIVGLFMIFSSRADGRRHARLWRWRLHLEVWERALDQRRGKLPVGYESTVPPSNLVPKRDFSYGETTVRQGCVMPCDAPSRRISCSS